MKTTRIGFIGGGRITKIFLQAFQNKSVHFDSVAVFEPHQETASALKKMFPQINLVASPEKAAAQEIVFLAVHPPVMMESLEKIKGAVKPDTMIISLAPKFTMEKIRTILPTEKVARMIPNATSVINKGYNPVTFSLQVNREEKKALMDFFRILGKTVEVEESMLEGYAIVSAMLPTYFWFQWKKMEEIAVKTGIPEAEAKRIIRSTLKRSLNLFYKSDLNHDEVIDLIPVKPIGDHEEEIERILETKTLLIIRSCSTWANSLQ